MSIDAMRSYIARQQAEIEKLEAIYGTGIRPSWVGEEIGSLMMQKQSAERKLAATEADVDAR
jgi:hypothetical protein